MGSKIYIYFLLNKIRTRSAAATAKAIKLVSVVVESSLDNNIDGYDDDDNDGGNNNTNRDHYNYSRRC